MIYDILLPVGGAVLIIILVLIIRSRKAEQEKNSRRRQNNRSGLVLERSAKEKKAGKSSLTGPVLAALVLIILGAWLAASYFTPGESASLTTALEGQSRPGDEPEADTKTMSGKIIMGQDSSTPAASESAIAQAATQAGAAGTAAAIQSDPTQPAAEQPPSAPAVPPQTSTAQGVEDPLTAAAKSMLPSISRMEQVGLMPTRGTMPPANSGQPTQTAKAAPAPKAPLPPATPSSGSAPKATNASRPAASSQPTGTGNSAAIPAPPASPEDDGILSGSRVFTVHLGSFADRSNADKYQSKLTGAGVTAFITETNVDGRMWYRVMSGRFPSQAEAEAHGREIRRRGLTTGNGRYLIKVVS